MKFWDLYNQVQNITYSQLTANDVVESSTMLYVGIFLAVCIIGGIIFYITGKKKQKSFDPSHQFRPYGPPLGQYTEPDVYYP